MNTHEIVNKIDEIILLEWQAYGMARNVQTAKVKCYKEIAPMVLNQMKYASKVEKRNI